MKKALIAMTIAPILFGCADSHHLSISSSDNSARIGPSDSVYVAQSENGQYGAKQYPGSGAMVSQIIHASLADKMEKITVSSKHSDYPDALAFAAREKYDFLIYPTILHWEDRATEWSAKPDKIQVKISVTRVLDKKVIRSGVIEGKSGLATFGGDKPQDLLPEPIDEYFHALF